jgi:hypothetical protein
VREDLNGEFGWKDRSQGTNGLSFKARSAR